MSTPVTMKNFIRAETDNYFAAFAKEGGFGKFAHDRDLVDLDHQTVIRMNRDTVYSRAVFDLDAGALTIALPEASGRFMSILAIDEDHYVAGTYYDTTPHRFTREQVGTRYLGFLIRTLVDPTDPADLQKVHALQDAIRVEQVAPGRLELPDWDQASLAETRGRLSKMPVPDEKRGFGTRASVDPESHLIATAIGWGGNPARDASYMADWPERNDGKTIYRLTVKDVPVDGFWSVTVYNKAGYFERNAQNAYSLNNLTAKPDSDGGFTIQFGGCDGQVTNCLPIMPGWNYAVRMYRPRSEILDGSWTFPKAQPIE
ncbi:DUF1214 domain-containing protein [Novosphingobium sp. ZW T3_23]|uniref:DUF1214 domain-containing protein n=1 Tax=Novosphingobium sp. ZW T3_23 TaxID=3378084 RepID=UPI0038529B7B